MVGAEAVVAEYGLGALLERLPTGLEQRIGDAGWQLSGGEASRVCLGRALLQGADLLILDESLAALDPKTRMRVIEVVTRRAGTVVRIAHGEPSGNLGGGAAGDLSVARNHRNSPSRHARRSWPVPGFIAATWQAPPQCLAVHRPCPRRASPSMSKSRASVNASLALGCSSALCSLDLNSSEAAMRACFRVSRNVSRRSMVTRSRLPICLSSSLCGPWTLPCHRRWRRPRAVAAGARPGLAAAARAEVVRGTATGVRVTTSHGDR